MIMSLSSHNLDAFIETARRGHFTRAAKALHITQSALSQRITKLEEQLETTVFIREKSGITLTPAGEELLRYCISKESLEKESIARIRDGSESLSGTIRIGGFSSVMRSAVLPALAPILKKHPDIRLSFIARELDELPHMLRRGEVDFIILYRELVHSDIECLKLAEEVNVLVEAKSYRGGDVFLDHDENDQTTTTYLKKCRRSAKVDRRFLDDVYGLIDGVKLGIGRAVVPLHLIKGDKDIRIIDKQTKVTFPVLLHYFSKPYYTRLHQLVVEQLKKEVFSYIN
jgi:DNA-binding transcriptional LysR family regulator